MVAVTAVCLFLTAQVTAFKTNVFEKDAGLHLTFLPCLQGIAFVAVKMQNLREGVGRRERWRQRERLENREMDTEGDL